MTVVSSEKDIEALTLTIVAEFDADLDRVWRLWADPRQLERWWGPPTWPATFEQHDFEPGGRSVYYMTGPEGDQAWGWWRSLVVDPPHRFEFEDGFADDGGAPSTTFDSTRAVMTLATVEGKTRMTTVTSFSSVEQLAQMIQMGMEEGMGLAMGQIDHLLAEVAA